jgi:predicted ATP-dependent serine protease
LQEEPLLEENRISEALELLSGYKSPSLSEDIGKAQLSEVLPRLTISFQDLEEMDLKKRGFLLLGNFPLERNTVTLISGDPGAGKTWLVYELAKIASTGERGFGGHCYASDRTKTLIVDGELPLKDIEERSKVMELGGIRHLSLLSKSLLEKHDIVPGLNLTDREVRQLLSDYLEENGIELLVLDNLFSLFGGIDLNSAEAWSPVNDWLLKLRSKGVSTILVHHPNKQGTQLGTHSKLFNINNALTLRREIPNDGDADCCCFSIKVDKQRGRGIKLSGKKFIFKDGEWSHEIKFRGKTEKDS